MLYVEGGTVKHVPDLEVQTELDDNIVAFATVVEFRDRKNGTLQSRSFPTSKEAEDFVGLHRGIAVVDEKGSMVPGQFVRLGDWDWFAFRPVWLSKDMVLAMQPALAAAA